MQTSKEAYLTLYHYDIVRVIVIRDCLFNKVLQVVKKLWICSCKNVHDQHLCIGTAICYMRAEELLV